MKFESNHYLTGVLSIFLIITFISASILHGQTEKAKKMTVLIITGGHDFERAPFFEMFSSFPNITFQELKQPAANQAFDTPLIKKYDLLVFYEMYQEIKDDQKAAFIKLLEEGKGVVFLHHSLASYQTWDEYEKILGGRYLLKEGLKPGESVPLSTYQHDVEMNVKITDPGHPVTKGVPDFIIHDEVYNHFRVLPTVQPLLTTDHPQSGKTIGWTNQYAQSRIVFIQLGHDHSAYQNPYFRQLVFQAMQWVVKK